MKVILTLIMLVGLAAVGMAQTSQFKLITPSDTSLSEAGPTTTVSTSNGYNYFLAGGAQYKYGEFGLYDVPNSQLGSAHSIGAFVEAARDFHVNHVIIAPRALAAIDRVFSDYSPDFTEYSVRPEVEIRLPLPRGVQPLVAGGFNYAKDHNQPGQLNPILGAGLQYQDLRGSIYYFFADGDRFNARGTLYRADYLRKLDPFGVRLSAELFNGQSDGPTKKHPGYEGYVLTFRVGLVK